MSTTLEKLQAEVEAEMISDPAVHLSKLEDDVSNWRGILGFLGIGTLLGLALSYIGASNGKQGPAFSYMMLVNPITITFLIFSATMLTFFLYFLKIYNKDAKKLKVLRSSNSVVNIEANRKRFWTELGFILDKEYDVLIPITQRKNGDEFKSPADAYNMYLSQEVNGVRRIIQLENLVPYLVSREIVKRTA